MPPLPAEPKVSLPGFALASAISSVTVFAGTDGCTTSTRGATCVRLTGAKSFTGS